MVSPFLLSNRVIKNRKLCILLSAIPFCAISACTDNADPVRVPETPPAEFSNATFPLAIGNYWVYVDSVLYDPQLSSVMTHSVASYERGWWSIAVNSIPQFSLQSRMDTAFSLSRGATWQDIQYIPNPALGDTVLFWRRFSSSESLSVRVYLLDRPVITPAGTFDSCSAYETHWAPYLNRVVTYFKPTVGPIAWEHYSIQDSLEVIQRTKLVFLKLRK